MLDTTTRVHVIQTGPSMAQGDISTPKALHSVKGAQLNPGFILRYMGAAIKTCTSNAEGYKNSQNWYGHRPILHGSIADKFKTGLANAR